MGMGGNPNTTIQPSEYFLQALEAQRSINSHIHEIEPSTPVFLYEIDLNEIKPAMVSYPNRNGPVKDGVIRVHNDFNLFNINRGIISWRGNLYFPFPIYGEQFDITSNGTIPTPKIKFSSQFLDDEFNSFYKYIRMQINELKDIVGSKVTRRKTFVRYLSANNFPAGVNPFNTFTDTPWASRDGDTLSVRSSERCPIGFAKWLVYTKKTTATTNKIFTLLRTDDRLKTLNIDLQKINYNLNSLDFFNLFVNEGVNDSNDVIDSFSSDNFIIPASAGYTRLIQNDSKEFRKLGTDNKIKVLCYYTPKAFTNNTTSTVNYPVTFSESSSELATFLSFRSVLDEAKAESFNYSISSQTTSSFTTSFSKPISGIFDINYLTIPTGIYTGINSVTNENAKLVTLKLNYNFGSATSGELDISFSTQFSNMPKLLFNSWGSAGFAYNQYLKNISSTGCTFVASHTGDNTQLGTQNINLIATDYITDDLNSTGDAQMYNSYHNMAKLYLNQIDKNQIDIYEVELTPDIYYIDRKAQEDSQNVVYELASLLDVEGIKLPGRLLLSKNCPFSYRGAGCLYEKSDRLTLIHSGVYGYVDQIVSSSSSGISKINLSSSQKCIGLQSAPPVADESNNTFYGLKTTGSWIDKGFWKQGTVYNLGNYIYIEKNQIKFYFVCKSDHTSDSINSPPNISYWVADSCSKNLQGCRSRWKENINFPSLQLSLNDTYGLNNLLYDPLVKMQIQAPKDGNGNQLIGILPFGGFPSVEGKFQSQQSPGGG
jgi:phage-related protein